MGGQDAAVTRALLSRGLVREEQLRALAARRPKGDPRSLAEVVVAERLVSREQLAAVLDPGSTHAPTLDLGSPPLAGSTPPGSGPGLHDPGASSRRVQLERGVTLALGGDLRVTCERLLGQGGMGTVHLVQDASLGRSAALKLVRGEGHPTRARRFRREIVLTARLDHPGIPPVYQAGRTATGQDYLLMRFVDGEALDAVLDRVHERRGSLAETREPVTRAPEPRDLLDALVKVAEAVAYAHSRGVVHRDLKPANIMLGAFGETFVMDWGLARDLAESRSEDAAVRVALAEGQPEARGLTQDGALLGTPGYMAPEQARGEDVDARADVFALGALLTEVLTGQPPIAGRTALEVLAKTGNAEVVLPRARRPDVAPELDAIAARCLALEPDDRYAGAGEVATDLKAYLEGRPVSVHRYGLADQTRRLVRRHPAPVAALGVATVLTIAGVIAVGRARDVAARAERSLAAQSARGAAEQAAAAVAALSSEGGAATLDRRVGALLAALQAAQRWRTLAQDDPAASAAQREAALGLGEVALQGEQWSLAAEAFTQALGLGDDAPARAAIERVERARNAEAERRRIEVEAVLADAASGELGRVPDGREDAVLRLARVGDAATVARLVAALEGVTARLEGALRAAWLEGGAPTRDERAAGEAEVEGLAEAVEAVLGAGLEAEVPRPHAQRVAQAEARLLRRASRSRAGGRTPLQLLATRQAAAVGQSALDVARVAADALGRLRGEQGFAALARHLAAERDPARALPAAMALCRLGGPRALRVVLAARERYGRHSTFGGRLDPLLVRIEGDVPLEAETAQGHLRRGEAYEARGQLAAAEADYDRAIALDPRVAWAFCRRGTVRSGQGRVAEALADYDRAVALDPADARFRANRAHAREATGDLAGAVVDFDEALRLDPQLAAARMNRGLLRQRAGDVPGALNDFAAALELDPLLVGGWINRGLLLLARGDLVGASSDLERALALDPRQPNALLGRAMLRRRQGDLEGALSDLEVARSVAPDDGPAAVVRAQVRADRGDLDGAQAELDAVVAQGRAGPLAVDALRERADIRRRRGDLQGSQEDLGRALLLAPGSIALLVQRAEVRREAGEPRSALADGERVIQLAPDDARGWIVRGEARSALGDHPGAAADLDRAIELDPRSARALYARCVARRRAGVGPDGCLPDLDRVVELEPDFLLGRDERGVARLNVGLTAGAAEDFLRCTQLAPGVARHWSNLGNALSLLGNEAAREALDRAIALDPRLGDAFLNRAIHAVRQGQARTARRDFERVIELEPRRAQAWEGRALSRRDQQDPGWAEDAQRAVTLDPASALAWCLLAEVQLERRDWRRALELVEKPLALPAHPPRAWLLRAVCRDKLGDVQGAITDAEAFLAAAPDGPEAANARRMLERLRAGR